MEIDERGATRRVILTRKYVIKLPRLKNGSRLFLCGLLSNVNESIFRYGVIEKEPNLPIIHYCAPFGLFLIMKRYRKVKHRGLFWVELARIKAISGIHEQFWDSDSKPENFAYDNRCNLIKIDNGAAYWNVE